MKVVTRATIGGTAEAVSPYSAAADANASVSVDRHRSVAATTSCAHVWLIEPDRSQLGGDAGIARHQVVPEIVDQRPATDR